MKGKEIFVLCMLVPVMFQLYPTMHFFIGCVSFDCLSSWSFGALPLPITFTCVPVTQVIKGPGKKQMLCLFFQ